ncbi:MAG: prolipoprotein diacylglyceryl transferase [Ruminococcaceae bacterium]|nr:prolipoprotein diacylglyceryl transferase [Oscillospiraceae bacterium]
MTATTNIIEFPKLGIFDFRIDRVAINNLFGTELDIYWYAIIITFGMILALSFCMWRAKDFGLKSDNVIDVALWAVPFGLIGARVYYVLMRLDTFESFWDMINFRNGGLAIYGGIIAGFITGLVFCKIKKINVLAMFDCASFGFFIGQAVGRWGNFVNGEAYGSNTDLPWGMTIQRYYLDSKTNAVTLSDYIVGPAHPTFLYESLWNILGLIIAIFIIRKLKKEHGECFFFYMGWYGLGRAFIEGLRTDSLKIFDVIRISQLLGIVFFVVSVVCFVLIRIGVWRRFCDKFEEKKRIKEGYYAPVFEYDGAEVVEEEGITETDLFVASLEAHKGVSQSEDDGGIFSSDNQTDNK